MPLISGLSAAKVDLSVTAPASRSRYSKPSGETTWSPDGPFIRSRGVRRDRDAPREWHSGQGERWVLESAVEVDFFEIPIGNDPHLRRKAARGDEIHGAIDDRARARCVPLRDELVVQRF